MSTSDKSVFTKSLPGLGLVGAIALGSTFLAHQPWLKELRISPLIVGILFGVLIGNTIKLHLPASIEPGIKLSASKILRLAIILYGFRITFDQIANIGVAGVALDIVMVSSTLVIGAFVGIRLLKMDRETALMTSAGAAICGAAAVIATEPVVKAEPHKTAVAVATVVCFGTLSMFLYPLVYRLGLVPMNAEVFGIYIGASVHEVAHVVGAGDAVGPSTSDIAVIVKMTRVMLLAPALIVMGWLLSRRVNRTSTTKTPVAIPWFAIGFILVAGFNSFSILSPSTVDAINVFDTFLLTMAMTALGLNTVVERFKGIGLTPLYLAFTLFLWLVVGGYALTQLFVG
ncbi:MAG: YeiH family protein [Bradymonadia bacterium]